MSRFLTLFITISIIHSVAIAQYDSTFPIGVTLGIKKEYSLKFPKSHYSDELTMGYVDINTDSVIEDRYDVEIAIHNKSTKPVFFWVMSCSWFENFQINNNYISMQLSDCDKNIPVLIQIKPNGSQTYNITLSKSVKFKNPCKNCIYGSQVAGTRIGLILIDDIYLPKSKSLFDYYLAMDDKSVWKIIWSNPLYLLNKDETSDFGSVN